MTCRRLALLVAAALAFTGCTAQADRDTLYQTSTLGALMEGVYDGDMSVAALLAHGNFGLGTFDALDGEMIVVDGTAYQVRDDGRAHPAAADMLTPFAAATWLDVDTQVDLAALPSLTDLCNAIDAKLTTRNVPYAIRLDGEFEYVKVRSVPRQSKPYPRLVVVAKAQPVFEHRNIRGTLVGFRLPTYTDGINVPGYHLHFIDADRTVGGHLLDCRLVRGTVTVDTTAALHVRLPATAGFAKVDLTGTARAEVHAVEK